MKTIFFNEKGFITKEVNGDKIEVRLMDNAYNTYFKMDAHLHHPKEMRKLIEELKVKGVKFEEEWF